MWQRLVLLGMAMAITIAGPIGCGDGRPQRLPVTGTVLFQGRPVEGADVMFMPKDGRAAMGSTNAKGRFELLTFEPGDGAIIGEHAVSIVKKVEAAPKSIANPYAPTRDVLPKRYGSTRQSGLTATVKAGSENDFTFDLKP